MSAAVVQGTIGSVLISAFEWHFGLCASELRFKSSRLCKMRAATKHATEAFSLKCQKLCWVDWKCNRHTPTDASSMKSTTSIV